MQDLERLFTLTEAAPLTGYKHRTLRQMCYDGHLKHRKTKCGHFREIKKRELAARGIKQVEVNCAYTSQECPSCGYVDKTNRRSQSKFKCKNSLCEKSGNADVTGAKVILRRSQDIQLSQPYLRKTDVLDTLVRRFVERCGNRVGELHGNSYFRKLCSGSPTEVARVGVLTISANAA
jgi:hypothetical protein